MEKREIVLACDCEEAEEFCHYLEGRGYKARIGHDTANWVDGCNTSNNPEHDLILSQLWDEYCAQY